MKKYVIAALIYQNGWPNRRGNWPNTIVMIRKIVTFFPFFFLFMALATFVFSQPFDCGGDFYLVLSNAGGESQLYRVEIDPITEDVLFAPLSTSGTGQSLNAIGYRQSDNYIYAINPSTYQLNRISANGQATPLTTLLDLIGNGMGYFAADITSDGQYMVLLGSNDSPGPDYSSKEIVFIDLSDPNYTITRKPLITNQAIYCTDIAFDPLSNTLYGFDLIANRLITIDPQSGQVDTQTYPTTDQADAMGALFFDAFGRLYGYGNNFGESESRQLFKIDTFNGAVTKLAQGPVANGKDGCSCPYTVRLEKTVSPQRAFPCTEVTYSFKVANASGVLQSGLALYDEMPSPFTIIEVIRNPFGGTVQSGPGGNVLLIENMEVPPGLDSVTVRVTIGSSALGIYANQATLSGLPLSMGEETISDNPNTLPSQDSTLLEVIPLYVDLQKDSLPLCGNELTVLDATTYGATYWWSDGTTDAILSTNTPGFYWVQVATPCQVASDSILLYTSDIRVQLGSDLEINEGDSVRLIPELNPAVGLELQWTDPFGNSLDCITCPQPLARPLTDVVYTLTATSDAGCIASDDIAIRVIKIRGVYAPNVFSPDGDGQNDFFFLQGQRDFEIPLLRIFNRWGAVVFERRDAFLNQERQGWNGTFKGAVLNSDVFVWYAEVKYPDGATEILSGDVLLLH